MKQIKAIEAKNVRSVLEELIRIFCPETEQEEIDENLSLYDYLDERRKYREYVNANGLDELAVLRKERDTQRQDENKKLIAILETLKKERQTLRQKQKENEKLKAELETLKKENDNLKHEAERQKKSSSTSRSSSSSFIKKARVPSDNRGWQRIEAYGTRCRIKDIGNCGGSQLKVCQNGETFTIKRAIREKIIFDGLGVNIIGAHDDLYFYYEVV